MKLKSLFTLALLTTCSPAPATADGFVTTKIAGVGYSTGIYEFTTKSGVHCIFVAGYQNGGLACNFKEKSE